MVGSFLFEGDWPNEGGTAGASLSSLNGDERLLSFLEVCMESALPASAVVPSLLGETAMFEGFRKLYRAE